MANHRGEPRPECLDCGRPLVAWVRPDRVAAAPGADTSVDGSWVAVAGACFCDRRTVLATRTRILLLQHPREQHVAIGTARMAHRALGGSRLRVGLDFADDPEVLAALARAPATYVLFPGPDALPVERLPRDGSVTLIVLDGTWWQARKLLKLNPAIAALPRVGFRPAKPSGYLIRREPADFCVSTIEALAEVLHVLEPEGERFERLLDPFHAMVERQRWFEAEVGASRHRSARRTRVSPGDKLAARLNADWSRLVCVQGEANAWPHRHTPRQNPETVHWIAHRPATAESFEAVTAPRRPLGPATSEHIELAPERLLTGGTVREWHDAWRGFTGSGDILVMWGTYYRDLAAGEDLPLTFPSIDLRIEASRLLRRRFGAIENSMAALEATPATLTLPGRGGRRLAALVGALEALRAPKTALSS